MPWRDAGWISAKWVVQLLLLFPSLALCSVHFSRRREEQSRVGNLKGRR